MAGHRHVTLPPFWADNARGWFAHAEARFRAKDIMEEWDRFDLAVAALPKEVVTICMAAVTNPDEDVPYTALKEDLLQQHSLTTYQRIERLFAVGVLGNRRPSLLLAEMMELCPDDLETSPFFTFLFLQRLPAWLRVLVEDEDVPIRQLAVKADRLFALHGHKQAATVAAVDGSGEDREEEADINAIQGGRQGGSKPAWRGRGGGQRGGQRSGHGGGHRGNHQQQQADGTAKTMTPSDAAAAAAGLCLQHWRHGEEARRCLGSAAKPCGWQGN